MNDAVIRAQKAISTPIPDVAPYDGKPIYSAATFATCEEDEHIRAIMPPNCHAARWNDRGVDLILNGGEFKGNKWSINAADGTRDGNITYMIANKSGSNYLSADNAESQCTKAL